jgi:hypothetical protein
MKDKIINQVVATAADIMDTRMTFNKLVAQQYERNNPGVTIDTVEKLRALNERIAAAIELMRECEGSWA